MTRRLIQTVKTVCVDSEPDAPAALNVQSGFRAEREHTHLGELFAKTAHEFYEQAAITAAAGTYRYDWLLAAARSIAHGLLSDEAFRTGDRVIILQANSPEYVASFYGTLLARGVAVPVPPDVDPARLEFIVNSTEPTHLLTQSRWVTRRPDLQGTQHATWRIPFPMDLGVRDAARNRCDVEHGDDLAAIFFTSGSSGTPKGVMLSHQNLISNARSIQQYLDLRPTDRPLCVLPFYHAFGNSVLQSHVLTGANLILDGSALFPESMVTTIAKHGATSLAGVPDIFRLLLDRSSLGRTPLPTLRSMSVAGGALPFDLAVQVAERIRPASLFVMYGQTEATARLSYLPPERLCELPGSIGRGVLGVRLEVVNEFGQPVAPGEVGEIRARGDNIMLGYWRDPAGTSEVLRDGYLHTGDLATIDRDGWIFVKGRRSSLIKIAGHRVHPSELENFIRSRMPIRQAVAVPFDLAGCGTRLALFAIPESELVPPSVTDIVTRCRSELPRHLVPDYVEVVADLPLNHALKIDRLRLTQIAEQAAARRRASA